MAPRSCAPRNICLHCIFANLMCKFTSDNINEVNQSDDTGKCRRMGRQQITLIRVKKLQTFGLPDPHTNKCPGCWCGEGEEIHIPHIVDL